MDLSWLQLMYGFLTPGDTQRHEGEHFTEISNRNHFGIMIEMCIAIAIYTFC